MSVSELRRVLSESTPITTAIALTLCGAAYFGGRQVEHLNMRVEGVEFRMQQEHDDTRDWRQTQLEETRRLNELLRTMSDISKDNKRRIDGHDELLKFHQTRKESPDVATPATE